jgi:hypothetical protein
VDRVKGHHHILCSRDELACFLVDQSKQLKALQVEWEVLDVLRQSNSADNQLNKGMHEQRKVTHLGRGQGEHPELHAVVELPAVNVLERVLRLQINVKLVALTKLFLTFLKCRQSCLRYWKPS